MKRTRSTEDRSMTSADARKKNRTKLEQTRSTWSNDKKKNVGGMMRHSYREQRRDSHQVDME